MKKPVRWILTGLLAALGHAAISQNVADGGTKAASTGSAGQSINAQILARFAGWQWRLKKGDQQMPRFDSSSVAGFFTSFRAAANDHNPAGISTRYNAIEAHLKSEHLTTENAPAAKLIRAIEQTLNDSKKYEQAQVSALTASLSSSFSDATQKKDTPVVAPMPSALPFPQTPDPAQTNPNAQAEQPKTGRDWTYVALALAAGIVVGAGGLLFLIYLKPAPNSHQSNGDKIDSRKPQPESDKDMRRQLVDLQKENTQLRAQLDRKDREIQGLRDEMSRNRAFVQQPSSATNATQKKVEGAAPTSELPAPIVSPPTPPLPTAAHFYVDAPSLPYLEHRRLGTDQSPLLEVHLTVPDGPAGTRATYEFSTAADQARVIAADVRNLRHFFDFELPLSNQFTRIATARPGKLERVGDRWEIRERAQLTIS